jgi:LAO/AO transport system kinase
LISKKLKSKKVSHTYTTDFIKKLGDGILAGDRRSLARGITLVESRLNEDQEAAFHLTSYLEVATNKAKCIAVTGPPGAGKSSFIESMGMLAIHEGQKVAVITIDPSSELNGGSILADKTRMPKLSAHPQAFVRTSPTGGDLGGINRNTMEVKRLCEAAAFQVIFVETVGVGQSESEVSHLVDMVIVLLQPGSGDDLQGIKKGLNEMADFFVVNKADGQQIELAREAKSYILASTKLGHKDLKGNHIVLHSQHDQLMAGDCYKKLMKRYDELFKRVIIEKRRANQIEYWFDKKIESALLDWFKNQDVYHHLNSKYLGFIRSEKMSLDEAIVLFLSDIKKKYSINIEK